MPPGTAFTRSTMVLVCAYACEPVSGASAALAKRALRARKGKSPKAVHGDVGS